MTPVRRGLILLIWAVAVSGAASAQFASSYSLRTLAGGDFAGDGGPATAALLNHLEGVAVDSKGAIYIADTDDHRVRKISPDGAISTVAGIGRAGFSGDGGPATAAQLRTPYGVAADRSGNLYIADLGNARIRRITPDGVISTFAGGGNTPAMQADSLPAASVALNSPRNVATDLAGTLYFSDFGGNRVYQVSAAGNLAVLAGTGLRRPLGRWRPRTARPAFRTGRSSRRSGWQRLHLRHRQRAGPESVPRIDLDPGRWRHPRSKFLRTRHAAHRAGTRFRRQSVHCRCGGQPGAARDSVIALDSRGTARARYRHRRTGQSLRMQR